MSNLLKTVIAFGGVFFIFLMILHLDNISFQKEVDAVCKDIHATIAKQNRGDEWYVEEQRQAEEEIKERKQKAIDAMSPTARRLVKAKIRRNEVSVKQKKNYAGAGFSIWDGSHSGLKKFVKQRMHNPSSFRHVETKFNADEADHILVKMTYRGSNAFGGIVTNWILARVDYRGNVISISGQG